MLPRYLENIELTASLFILSILHRELGFGQEQWFPTSLQRASTTTSGRPCRTSSTTSAPLQTFSLSQGINFYDMSRKMFANVNRKAKDTDYLLITEDMKTYGCGCCSIGLGKFKTASSFGSILIPTGILLGLQTISDFCSPIFLALKLTPAVSWESSNFPCQFFWLTINPYRHLGFTNNQGLFGSKVNPCSQLGWVGSNWVTFPWQFFLALYQS